MWWSTLPDTYLIRSSRSQAFTAVYIKRLVYECLFNKVAGLQLKKDSGRDIFSWVCLIFRTLNLQNIVGWWLLLLNTIHFLCCRDLISKMLLSTLVIFWLSLNIFRENNVSRLWTAVSRSPRQLIDLLLIKQVICYCYYRSKTIFQQFSLKIMSCKTSQVSHESVCDEAFFDAATYSRYYCLISAAVLKRTPSQAFSSEYTYLNILPIISIRILITIIYIFVIITL